MSRVIARAQVANTHNADFSVRLQFAWRDPMMLRFKTIFWTYALHSYVAVCYHG
jgi:hypothetical protein